jgi:probable rRNA maturation factor
VPVEIRCTAERGRSFVRGLRVDAERLLDAAKLPDTELSLTIVSDRSIRKLNRDYRGKDAPTDVLSFSQIEEAGVSPQNPDALINRAGLVLGDVVISIDTALLQALEFGVTPTARLRTLLIHGFLHLLGYDHERSPADARRMFARERALRWKMSEQGGRVPGKTAVVKRKRTRHQRSVR